MHKMGNYYVSKLMPLIAESGMSVVANPLLNIVIAPPAGYLVPIRR